MNKEVKKFFDQFTPEVAEIGRAVFKITEKIMLPEKKMWIDQADKMITFGTERNMKGEICYIKPLKDSVNLGFFHGAKLNDRKKLLQGTGKLLRHVKFKKKENIDIDGMKELLETALEEHNDRQKK
ncbi:MAG: DUF1801 domain-containing protein [Ignavibacteria bacterium]|nr:DUF1801 domain-containing protein [Ignavibacteria bacterium]